MIEIGIILIGIIIVVFFSCCVFAGCIYLDSVLPYENYKIGGDYGENIWNKNYKIGSGCNNKYDDKYDEKYYFEYDNKEKCEKCRNKIILTKSELSKISDDKKVQQYLDFIQSYKLRDIPHITKKDVIKDLDNIELTGDYNKNNINTITSFYNDDYPTIPNNVSYHLNLFRGSPSIKREYLSNKLEKLSSDIFEKAYRMYMTSTIPNKKEIKMFKDYINLYNTKKIYKPGVIVSFDAIGDKNNHPQIELKDCSVDLKTLDTYNDYLKPLHWGQRKLMLSEIDFLTRILKFAEENYENNNNGNFRDIKIPVLYPGSAAGYHLMMLLDMFPQIVLFLWDPAKFSYDLNAIDRDRRGIDNLNTKKYLKKYKGRVFINMELEGDDYNEWYRNSENREFFKNYKKMYGFFTSDGINKFKQYAEENNIDLTYLSFITDIRMFEPNILEDVLDTFSDRSHDSMIYYRLKQIKNASYDRDMRLQKDWFLESGANFGIFKFKLPVIYYGSQKYYKYLDGEIIFQTWSPVGSTESRLYVNKFEHKGDKKYDNVKYYNQMKYFNLGPRMSNLRDELLDITDDEKIIKMKDIWGRFFGKKGIIGADCWIETQILLNYFKLLKYSPPTKYDVINTIADTTMYIKRLVKNDTKFRFRNNKDSKEYAENRELYSDILINNLDYNSKLKDLLVCPIKIRSSY